MCSRRSSRRLPPIIWRSARRASCFVTGPTTSSYDRVFRISPAGEVSVFFRGLGRPQGLAFDRFGNLYVAGIARRQARHRAPHSRRRKPKWCSAEATSSAWRFLPTHRAIIATNSALYHPRLGRRRASPERLAGRHAGGNHRRRFGTSHPLIASIPILFFLPRS